MVAVISWTLSIVLLIAWAFIAYALMSKPHSLPEDEEQ